MFKEGFKEKTLLKLKKFPLVKPFLMSLLAGTILFDSSPASADPGSFTATLNCYGSTGEGYGFVFLPDRQEELYCSVKHDERSQSKAFTAQLPFVAEVGLAMELYNDNSPQLFIGWEDYDIKENPDGSLSFYAVNKTPYSPSKEMATNIWTTGGAALEVTLDIRKN